MTFLFRYVTKLVLTLAAPEGGRCGEIIGNLRVPTHVKPTPNAMLKPQEVAGLIRPAIGAGYFLGGGVALGGSP